MTLFLINNYNLNIFSEMSFFLNKADYLLKIKSYTIVCKFNNIRFFLFFEQIFDFNLLVYRRIFAFCFFIFLINKFSKNLYNFIQETSCVIGYVCTLYNCNSIFDFIWTFYIFYMNCGLSIRRKEFVKDNCLVFNIYNLFLFPGFLNCYDDFEDLRFCSLKIVYLLSHSGIYMRLFLSSLNLCLLC